VVEVDRDTADHWTERGWASPSADKPTTRRKPAGK
jgi:hypothetical protein